MTTITVPKLTVPSILFLGVTTGNSFINRLFPVWADVLELGKVELKGLDLPLDSPPNAYRQAVDFIKSSDLARGALVTTHKINIHEHARDRFDRFDPYADRLGEVSSISKDGGDLVGHAKDPITSGLALEAYVGTSHWAEHPEAEALIMGSGGAALALATYLLERPAESRPSRIVLTGRRASRIDHLQACLASSDADCRVVAKPEEHDRLTGALPPHSLVVNATGMGKDRPGSPITDAAAFPEQGIAWEFNYRGELRFLHQARAQAQDRHLRVEDGWVYFLHGWSQVIAEVFHFSLDAALFGKLQDAADRLREENPRHGR